MGIGIPEAKRRQSASQVRPGPKSFHSSRSEYEGVGVASQESEEINLQTEKVLFGPYSLMVGSHCRVLSRKVRGSELYFRSITLPACRKHGRQGRGRSLIRGWCSDPGERR